jgi:hypothetical protein
MDTKKRLSFRIGLGLIANLHPLFEKFVICFCGYE